MGSVQRIVALLNPASLNLGMQVVIGVVWDRSTPQSFADFEKSGALTSSTKLTDTRPWPSRIASPTIFPAGYGAP